MSAGYPLHRFEEFGPLSAGEQLALEKACEQQRTLRRHATIRSEGSLRKSFYLLIDGWVAASQALPDGKRQIFKVHLPGDALGTTSMVWRRSVEELTALTEVTFRELPLKRFGRLLEQHPRMASRFLLSVQLERMALVNKIIDVGRGSAERRLAAFIIDIADRLQPLGLVQDGGYKLPILQEQLADVLGLTPVHVNRTLRSFDKQGLIARERFMLRILDRDKLVRMAGKLYSGREIDAAWLPAASM